MYRQSDATMVNSAQICIAAHLLLRLVQATVVSRLYYQHPADVTVEPNQWAHFNCTVNCSCVETVSWYMVRHDSGPITSNSTTGCTSDRRTYFLKLLATEELNKVAIYCVAFESSDCQSGCSSSWKHYSKPALVMVEHLSEEPVTTPTPSPSPSLLSSCTPLQKMVTSQVTVTPQVTVTSQVTVIPQAVTVTTTETQTITYTPSPTPTGSCTGTTEGAQTSSAHSSSQAVVLTGLGIVAAVLMML